MTRLTDIPDDYVCPECKEAALSVVVDALFFSRWGDFQASGIFKEDEGPPESQCVRVFCDECDARFPITAELADRLQQKVDA